MPNLSSSAIVTEQEERVSPDTMLLAQVLAELRGLRADMAHSSESHSSAELKVSSARPAPDATIKIYEGSSFDGLVEATLEQFGRLKREADARSLDGWRETVNGSTA